MTIFKRPRQSMRRRFFAPFMCVVLCAITTATVHAETLDVRTKEFKPFAFEQNGKWVGFSLDLWEEVAKELGVQSKLKGEKSVSELLKTVSSKKADVAIAGITITAEREGLVDFTHPFYESGLQILTLTESSDTSALDLVKASGLLDILFLLLLTLLLVSHLMWIAERIKGGDSFSADYPRGIWDAFWWAAVTVTTVGYGDKVPKSDAGRVIALVWMFSGLILVSFFTASVTTTLTLDKLSGSIAGPNDLRGRAVAAPEGSTSAKAVRTYGGNLRGVESIDEACALLEEGEVEAVVYDAPVLQYKAATSEEGKLSVAGPVFQRESYGIALQEGSPYREKINTILLNLRENGKYDQLHERWFGSAGE